MNGYARVLFCSSLLILYAEALLGQQFKSKVTIKPIGQTGIAAGVHIGEGCPIMDEPYSDAWETETFQTLADGTQIHHKQIVDKSYRDSQGRTRMELYGPTIFAKDAPETLISIWIHDPVAGSSYLLNPRNHTARQSNFRPDPDCWEKLRKRANTAGPRPSASDVTQNGGNGAGNSADPCGRWRITTKVEDLGTQSIKGLDAHGTKWTRTIPTCVEGNDHPLEVVTERWISDELKIFALTRESDPRSGEGIGRATQLQRSEPDISLFQVPPDYTIVQ